MFFFRLAIGRYRAAWGQLLGLSHRRHLFRLGGMEDIGGILWDINPDFIIYKKKNNNIGRQSNARPLFKQYQIIYDYVITGVLLQLMDGKHVLLFNSYSYCKSHNLAKGTRWACTKHNRCKAYLHLDHDLYFIKGNTDHSHPPPVYKTTKSGKYVKVG